LYQFKINIHVASQKCPAYYLPLLICIFIAEQFNDITGYAWCNCNSCRLFSLKNSYQFISLAKKTNLFAACSFLPC